MMKMIHLKTNLWLNLNQIQRLGGKYLKRGQIPTPNEIKPKYDLNQYFRVKTVCALNKIC